MIAAENGALPGGKVGGMGDVVREVPTALAALGCEMTVVTPAYGVFAALPGSIPVQTLQVACGGTLEPVSIHEVSVARAGGERVRCLVFEHPLFSACGRGHIYCNDPPDKPFATDAGRFALFCAAVAQAIEAGIFGDIDILHLHDWHTALLLVLRRYRADLDALQSLPCVYTVHNLAFQGIRPFEGSASSLREWYPDLTYEPTLLADPRWRDCVNPMAVGIRLADAVHVVSPSYADEVLKPSAADTLGFHGGEGLQDDLLAARDQGRLHGILNGCDYQDETEKLAWPRVVARLQTQLQERASTSADDALALQRLGALSRRPELMVTSVGRITAQKVRLLHEPDSSGSAALKNILHSLGDKGVFLLLGTGDPAYERFLRELALEMHNFIFLRGYSDVMADTLYRGGDLFLMPSSFEPCGISQMLAMRAGQPCLAHAVGGLRDTILDEVNGFLFNGETLTGQADALGRRFEDARTMKLQEPRRWAQLRDAAAAARFEWRDCAPDYIERLYTPALTVSSRSANDLAS